MIRPPHDNRERLSRAEQVQPFGRLARVVEAIRTGGNGDEQAIDEPFDYEPG